MSRRRRQHSSKRGFGSPPVPGQEAEPPKVDRKTRQLCGQVAQTLNFVLWGECNDDVLRMLYVSAVDPAPDASRLLVTVEPQLSGSQLDTLIVLERLAQFKGKIRSEVANAIHRKKTPELLFRFTEPVPPQLNAVE